MTTLLDCKTVNPTIPVRSVVIWLHGLGAAGDDFLPIIPNLGLNDIGVRFVFPHAPQQAVTINGGMVMPAWYDIYGLAIDSQQDETGIMSAVEKIKALIEWQHQEGIPYHHIVLVGFSQGGAVALATGLQYHQRLAGIMSLSAYLPIADKLLAQPAVANAEIPIFMAHGHHDMIINNAISRRSYDYLYQHHYHITWKQYDMAHEICPEEISDIATWLRERLS